mmetsp:Transcript_5704/g.18555  ORF Transcript_5704/g.18555 Transcript_5704/m.18555 type:complete len:162 (-) Transcript_5704:1510-1995(-)
MTDLEALDSARQFGVDAAVDEDDIFRWTALLRFGGGKASAGGADAGDTPLAKDLRKLGEPGVLLSLSFPPDYPFAPPFVRVVRPRFQFHTGHVTVGGSICMELLTRSGWNPANDLESLLIQIRSEMITGGARLEPKAAQREYSEAEAQEAFRRVASQHGWQ